MEDFTSGLFALGFLLILFLICRELVCWYWKINEMVRTQKEISAKLDQVVAELQAIGGKR